MPTQIKEHRISAAGIIIHRKKILLVRYKNPNGTTYLVGPGGKVETQEDMHQTVIRETQEETGLLVNPGKLLFVEDLLTSHHRMIKVWFFCSLAGGKLAKTHAAHDEGIIDVAWYRKDQLANETAYPAILMNIDWEAFTKKNFEAKYLGLNSADF